jgi:CBS-domain-containing membrane protein
MTTMPNLDPTSDRSERELSALLREARSLLRRADKLFAAAAAVDDRVATGLATEVRTATEQLVHHLARLEQQRQHRAREAVRRSR